MQGNTLCKRLILELHPFFFTLKVITVFKSLLHIFISEPPFFTEKPEAVSLVSVGGRKVFECKVAGTPEISMKWFKDGVQIHQSLKYKISFFTSVAILEVCVVSQQDSGKYFCEASNEAGRESCIFELVVKGWFSFLFVKGSTAAFASKVAGSAPFSVTWSKDKKPVLSSQKYIIVDSENVGLKIQDCDVDDVGTYQCVVANEVGIPPTFIKKIKNSVRLGQQLTLTATVNGSEPLTVSWVQDKEHILREDDNRRITFENNVVGLVVPKCVRADSGNYTITVENAAGKKTATLIEGLIVKAGTTIALPAKMVGIPLPTAKWMTDGKEITSEGRYHIQSADSTTTLSIPECQRADTGEYILTVSNPAGSKTVALHVTVLDLPGPPIGPINIMEVTPDYMMIQWRAPKDDGGTPITNYVVEKKDVKKPWEPWSVVSSSGTVTRAKVSRLEKGREYIVRVRAENKIGIGAPLESPPTIAKHMFNPPGPPGLPECSDITENAVTVSWSLPDYDGGSPISGYVVERREMTGKWIRVNKTPVLDLRYRVSGLFEGNTYEFRVFAENIAGISEPSLTSDPIKATRAITKPGPPGNLKLKDWSKSHADICWTKPTRDGGSPILGYVIEAQKSGTAQWDRINKDLVKMCAYRVPGLIEGLEYRIRIRATNKVGDSEPRELPQTILAKDILVPPEVVVDVSCRDSVTVRAGQIISLITRVKGRPDPEITWTKDARALGDSR
uniref:Titin n=1 Tax=Oreochromis niloticus TaxID=8128 RepID=A0A669C266_ORENI